MGNPPAGCKPGAGGEGGLYATFTHYITGKVYRAADYGYKAWPIGRGRKKK